nr:MAG TPA: hypothetical protein [Caudoviricetes sp.]
MRAPRQPKNYGVKVTKLRIFPMIHLLIQSLKKAITTCTRRLKVKNIDGSYITRQLQHLPKHIIEFKQLIILWVPVV